VRVYFLYPDESFQALHNCWNNYQAGGKLPSRLDRKSKKILAEWQEQGAIRFMPGTIREHNITIQDLEYLVRADAHVLILDPTCITNRVSASQLQDINRVIQLARTVMRLDQFVV
jgi:hypothetical protein